MRKSNEILASFPAGKYYIGDPCYIFGDSWMNVLEQTNYFEDSMQFINGVQVCAGSTAYGDGTYKDNKGREYAVDAGLIGILPIELLSIDNKETEESINADSIMHIVEFDRPFNVHISDGIFQFGDIEIITDGSDEEEEDYLEEDDYDYESDDYKYDEDEDEPDED